MLKQLQWSRLTSAVAVCLIVLVCIMPLHAFFVTLYGNFLPGKVVVQAWKEILASLVLVLSIALIIKNPQLLARTAINYCVIGIVVISLIVSALGFTTMSTLLFGIKTNLVVLSLFLCAQIVAQSRLFDTKKVYYYILIPAGVVSVIALLQATILSPEWLTAIGYSIATIDPTQYVENTGGIIRIFSTLGGPNQLGAYLILPIMLSATLLWQKRDARYASLVLVFGATLFLTFSRSAWLGVLAGLVSLVFLSIKTQRARIWFAGGLGVVIIGFALLASNLVCTRFSSVNALLLHGGCTSGQVGGSDSTRIRSLQNSLDQVRETPLGLGLGSAGPASFRGDNAIISENWYLQIAIEVGIVGLVLYLVFIGLILIRFYRQVVQTNSDSMYYVLIATVIGIAVANMFLHTLADSTLSIIVFIFLGVYVGKINNSTGKKV